MRFYAFKHTRFQVTFHLERDYRYRWMRIFGLGIGSWFVGAIKGTELPEVVPEVIASPRP